MTTEHDEPDPHQEAVHNRARHPADPPAGRDQTHTMTSNADPLTHWISHLDATATTLRQDPTMAGTCQAMALAWHTAAAVHHYATPTTALGWVNLTEALTEARQHLMDADPAAATATIASAHPPAAIVDGDADADLDGAPPHGGRHLDDTLLLRQTITVLVTTAATALRQLAAATEDSDRALATATAALTLQRTETWP